MKNTIYISFLALISLFLVMVSAPSCKKAKESKIIGVWKSIPLHSSWDDETYWEFTPGGNLYRTFAGVPSDTGTYFIEQNLFESYVTIDNLIDINGENVNGRYRIEKLNKSILNLLREVDVDGNNGYKRREFVKQ
jgi:hypothetical protein